MSHTDLFARTTAFGLGTDGTWTYDWNGRDTIYAAAADSLYLVDGSKVVIPINDWDSYTILGAAPVADGSASFDFYVPVLADGSNQFESIVLRLGSLANSVTLAVETDFDFDRVAAPHIKVGSANGDGLSWNVFASIGVDPGNWYTAKVGWASDGRSGYKLWKVGDPEPPVWSALSTTAETSSFADDWIDFWYGSDNQPSAFDNLTIDDTDPDLPNGQIRLDAAIVGPNTPVECDDFSRVVAHGLGDGYAFIPSTSSDVFKSNFNDETVSPLSVDGAKVVASSTNSGDISVYQLPHLAALEGVVEFDIYVPATWDNANSQPQWQIVLDSGSRVHGIGVDIQGTPGTGVGLLVGLIYNGGSTATWNPSVLGAWYTVQLYYRDSDGHAEMLIKPQGSDDSSAEFTRSATMAVDNQGFGDRLLLLPPGGDHDFFDNLCYRIVVPANPSFTADAVLRKTQTGSLTADAYIAIAKTGSLTVGAVLKRIQTGTLTLRAAIANGESGVHIRIDGEDVTDDVLFADAEFVALVNGAPGTFMFRVRDDAKTRVVRTGAEVTLDINGVRRFGGYALSARETFFFDVEDTSVLSKISRALTVSGVDYNILFAKRVLYDKARPSNVALRDWPAGTQDDTIIRYVLDHYTDLAGDGITTEAVDHVGFPNPDQKGVVGSGGLYVGDFMREVNRLISAVWYISPDKDLTFADVDTPNASVGLSDHPGAGQIGYREFGRNASGLALANDALCWGAAIGFKKLVFGRTTDAPSIAAHKRWQYGEYSTQIGRQTSINERADSVVNGTPQSKRGGKDDQVSWRAVTFNPAFLIGQKVEIESAVWDVSDTVPIRRMRISWPTTNREKPKFELTLSHEIDEPWNIYEFLFPKFRVPQIRIPPFITPPPRTIGACGLIGPWDKTVESLTDPSGWTPVTGSLSDTSADDSASVGYDVVNLTTGPFRTEPTEQGIVQFKPSTLPLSFDPDEFQLKGRFETVVEIALPTPIDETSFVDQGTDVGLVLTATGLPGPGPDHFDAVLLDLSIERSFRTRRVGPGFGVLVWYTVTDRRQLSFNSEPIVVVEDDNDATIVTRATFSGDFVLDRSVTRGTFQVWWNGAKVAEVPVSSMYLGRGVAPSWASDTFSLAINLNTDIGPFRSGIPGQVYTLPSASESAAVSDLQLCT